MYCPECKTQLEGTPNSCYICGTDLQQIGQGDSWVVVGTVENSVLAGLAEETLKSSDIEVVVISKSGFFGAAGLPLNPFYKADTPAFEISVPVGQYNEAVEVLEMTMGDQWQKKDK